MRTRHYNILLVEDEPDDIFLLQRAFGRLNLPHSLQVIEDGEAAIAYLSRQEPYADAERYPFPTLILLDLKLPRLSGFEVLAWLRQQPELRRLLVVVLTSSQETLDINRAYDLGANSYLVKPVDFSVFLEMVRSLELYWLMLNEKPLLPNNS